MFVFIPTIFFIKGFPLRQCTREGGPREYPMISCQSSSDAAVAVGVGVAEAVPCLK